MYGPGSSSRSSAGSHKQCNSTTSLHSNRNLVEVDNVKFKNSSSVVSRTSMQTGSAQSVNRAGSLFLDSGAITQNHAAGRRSRGTKQNPQSNQHSPVLLEQHLSHSPTVPPQQEQQTESSLQQSQRPTTPSHPECASNTRHSSEDSDIAALIETMDKDFDHPESPSPDVFTEQTPSPVAKNKGNKLLLTSCTWGGGGGLLSWYGFYMGFASAKRRPLNWINTSYQELWRYA